MVAERVHGIDFGKRVEMVLIAPHCPAAVTQVDDTTDVLRRHSFGQPSNLQRPSAVHALLDRLPQAQTQECSIVGSSIYILILAQPPHPQNLIIKIIRGGPK